MERKELYDIESQLFHAHKLLHRLRDELEDGGHSEAADSLNSTLWHVGASILAVVREYQSEGAVAS